MNFSAAYDSVRKQADQIFASQSTYSTIDGIIKAVGSGQILPLPEAGQLLQIKDKNQYQQVVQAAYDLTTKVHGDGVGLIAPLYFSNVCQSACGFCDMSTLNKELGRTTLTAEQFAQTIDILKIAGYKTIELVGGSFSFDSPLGKPFREFMKYGSEQVPNWAFYVDTFTPEEYRRFANPKTTNVTMIHWQETYDAKAYAALVLKGRKADFNKRLDAHDNWQQADGGRKLGVGVLAGASSDFLMDIFMTLAHGTHLRDTYGAPPTVFGTVRITKTDDISLGTQALIFDEQMYLATAVYRLAFPHADIISTSREGESVIQNQLRAGATFTNFLCTTNPLGYLRMAQGLPDGKGQFHHENPSLDAVTRMVEQTGRKVTAEKELGALPVLN